MSLRNKAFTAFDRAVAPALGVAAAAVLFAMMVLTCTDVIGRYFFNQPLYGAFEITEMLLAALIFAGLPLVTIRNDHVTVDVLDPVTPDWLLRAQHVAACAVAFVSTTYLTWRLWIRAVNLDNAGETTAQLKFKLAYLTYAMSLLMALTALAFLILTFRRPQRHVAGEGSAGQGLGP
jgi:TRAP-type transport system small permease protein